MMLTVQTRIGNVKIERMNGSIQSRYHGYTTGAHKRDAAIGQANASPHHGAELFLDRAAASKPASAASPAATLGGITRSRVAKTGSLKRNLCTYVASEPKRMWPWSRKGT